MPRNRVKWGIVKLSSIGDVVHALPVAAAIRRAIPDARIEWIVEPPAAALLQNSPVIDEAIVLDTKACNGARTRDRLRYLGGFLKEIRRRKYDIVLDLQGLLKSGVIAKAAGASECYGYDWLREGSQWLVQRIPARTESVHVVDKLLDVVRFLDLDPEPVTFPIGLTDLDRDHVDRVLDALGVESGSFVAINPAAAWRSKEWPADRFAVTADRIARDIGMPVLVLGGQADRAQVDAVRAAAVLDHAYLAGEFNLREYAEVARRAAVYVGCDTGPTHVAAAAGAPCVMPMGPTDPARNGPYGEGHIIIHKGHDCSPCKKRECPDPICMTEIEVDEILDAVYAMWSASIHVVGAE